MHAHHRLSVAPMMAYTDRHYRWMMRLFSKRCLLYTEMAVATTLTYNLRNRALLDRVLGFDPVEAPLAAQLGGDDPATLQTAARLCEDYGYDEINLNIGCPSDKVQKGRFGVCLMQDPERVADIVAAIGDVVSIPVTVKHRIGVDHQDDYPFMADFVDRVRRTGCNLFAVHARKAWLKGLSPAQNRSKPPLVYERVYRLKRDFPELTIVLNGGVQTLEDAVDHLARVDGVMMGRAAYYQPQQFDRADELIFGEPARPPLSDLALLEALDGYFHRQLEAGVKLSLLAKHLPGLFKSRPNARRWRQSITKLIQDKPKRFSLPALYRDAFAGVAA